MEPVVLSDDDEDFPLGDADDATANSGPRIMFAKTYSFFLFP